MGRRGWNEKGGWRRGGEEWGGMRGAERGGIVGTFGIQVEVGQRGWGASAGNLFPSFE